MSLDAATLSLVAQELKAVLVDARIDKIFEPTRDEVVVSLRTRQGGYRLLLCARSGSARACLTNAVYENPSAPPSFCMLLRKHFSGGKLLDIRCVPDERILFFDYQCTTEMGDTVRNTMAAELMGRYSNIVLIREDGKIIDALKRVDFEDSEIRQLLPGLAYTLPPKPDKPSFLTTSPAGLVAAVANSDTTIAKALMAAAGGVGPVVCREAAYRAVGGAHVPANEMTAPQQAQLAAAIADIQADYAAAGKPYTAFAPDGAPCEFSFTPLTQYSAPCTGKTYESFSLLLEGYYATKDRAERMRAKSRNLSKTVHNLLERAVRKQAARMEEKQQSENAEQLRVFGELLNAHLYAFQRGDRQVTVQNYYDGQEVTIPLDVRLTPSGNAQKYFKDYKKKLTAAKMLETLLADGEREIEYLTTVQYEVDAADGENALNDIRAELKGQGYLKYFKLRDKKAKPADFLRYRSTDGFLILVGRNNLQNDKLTLKTARGKDMWFHTQKAPGSHTVVMSEGQDIPEATQAQAAMLAVQHSSQAAGEKVPVDYTLVKNVRKTNDCKPGMVLYDHYKTLFITVDTAKLPPQEK